jgi:hypothetical protein
LKAMGFMAQRARYRGIDDLLITVHPHHVSFYQRFIGFEQIGEARPYGSVLNNLAVPLALDLIRLSVNHPRAYQRFFGQPFPTNLLAHHPWSEHVTAELSQVVASCELTLQHQEHLSRVA